MNIFDYFLDLDPKSSYDTILSKMAILTEKTEKIEQQTEKIEHTQTILTEKMTEEMRKLKGKIRIYFYYRILVIFN